MPNTVEDRDSNAAITGQPDDQVHGHPFWLVGAAWEEGDQLDEFLEKSIWQNGFTDRLLDSVKSMRPGERIAVKSTYTRKKDLPFDNRGLPVSTMAIKAVGTIQDNLDDGRMVRVTWSRVDPVREWYFYTGRTTIWRVQRGNWMADALIDFTFEDVPQDYDRFCNAPYWRARFGTQPVTGPQRFGWTRFFEALADKLLAFRHDRRSLVESVHAIASRHGIAGLTDHFIDGAVGPLRDIDPFTTFGLFNRGIKEATRSAIASDLADFVGLDMQGPEHFDGIPVLNNQNTWFFGFENKRKADDIDVLWQVFAAALRLSQADTGTDNNEFVKAYDEAVSRFNVAWNLTTGFYWIRPWSFPTLDSQSREYITDTLKLQLGPGHRRVGGAEYLALMERLETRFQQEDAPIHSYPELSAMAWEKQQGTTPPPVVRAPATSQGGSYSLDGILEDGCFIERSALEMFLDRLRTKKNVILQGPPGTGKTWLAKRLAYALIGRRDPARIRALQFHPNLSYEDFVRGWRPSGDGKLTLVDGPFLEAVRTARAASDEPYVVVIEEINRGNPAQIFGEMLTLLEADKRSPDEALEICYRRPGEESVYLPPNLYVIGTMNVADRSIAIVDLALRRRFAFVYLKPLFNDTWRSYVHRTSQVPLALLDLIAQRLSELNRQISSDTSLGPQFSIGHSYVTPPPGLPIDDPTNWFRQVVETEILPLLQEYWFDAQVKADNAHQLLLAGL